MAANRGQVITSYTASDGKGYFESNDPLPIEDLPGGANIRRVYALPEVPIGGVKIGGDKLSVSVSNKSGATFLDVEMAPGQLSPMHATPSIDFGVMISGEIWLILDSGEERCLRPGDLYVQKAANHAWENRTDKPARLATILIAAQIS